MRSTMLLCGVFAASALFPSTVRSQTASSAAEDQIQVARRATQGKRTKKVIPPNGGTTVIIEQPPPQQAAPVQTILITPTPCPAPSALACPGCEKLEDKVQELERKQKELEAQLAGQEKRLSLAEELLSYQTLSVGLGVGVPKGDGAIRALLEVNAGPVAGYYYVAAGYGIAVVVPVKLWMLRLKPIGFGLFKNADEKDPILVSDYHRSWDLMLISGVEARVWKGLMFNFELNWFIPLSASTPAGIMEEKVNEGSDQVDPANPTDLSDAGQTAKQGIDVIADAYKRAWRTPMIVVSLNWVF